MKYYSRKIELWWPKQFESEKIRVGDTFIKATNYDILIHDTSYKSRVILYK